MDLLGFQKMFYCRCIDPFAVERRWESSVVLELNLKVSQIKVLSYVCPAHSFSKVSVNSNSHAPLNNMQLRVEKAVITALSSLPSASKDSLVLPLNILIITHPKESIPNLLSSSSCLSLRT